MTKLRPNVTRDTIVSKLADQDVGLKSSGPADTRVIAGSNFLRKMPTLA